MKRILSLLLAWALILGAPLSFGQVTTDAAKTGVQSGLQVLASSGAALSITGTISETTLATITLPGGSLGANGLVRITTMWSFTSSANSKTLKVKFGAGTPMQQAYTAVSGVQQVTIVRNRAATNSQVGFNNSSLSFGSTSGSMYTSSVDTALDVAIAFTATLANTGETITLESYTIEYLR